MITIRHIRESLRDKFSTMGELLSEFATVTAFGAVVSAVSVGAEPRAALLPALLAAAGASAKACALVARRAIEIRSEDGGSQPPPYERFRVVFFTLIQRSFMEAVSNARSLSTHFPKGAGQPRPEALENWRKGVTDHIARVEETEIRFHYSLEPLPGIDAYLDACGKWLVALLTPWASGVLEQTVGEIKADALVRFSAHLANSEAEGAWVRSYLAIDVARKTDGMAASIASIRSTLDGWLDRSTSDVNRQAARWAAYREYLGGLPDQNESMFNESFGVRKVFVSPLVFYHRAGLPGRPDRRELAPRLGRLLGALVSNRLDNNDLIILCGGPGSGKSTLCRVLASELSSVSSVYPIFLRLRRCREGADVSSFIEDSLVKEGVIARLADLRELPNLVLILDGFDELVLASRSRLRHFFSVLLEDVRHGALRNARVIVSGRDTLFPGGEGLPRGSHVLSVQPFDRARVALWGGRWRQLHDSDRGATFHPEAAFPRGSALPASSTLQQLVAWPLTLHLIARLHTVGRFDVTAEAAPTEKAYLYREILRETADRQTQQAEGRGRLDASRMRDFLRDIAWEMYVRGVDSLEVTELIPLARRFFHDADETALAELAEVAVVNAPALTKGEDTGFEFVHKSFGEFLTAECFARTLESVAHRVTDAAGEPVWYKDLAESAALCGQLMAHRTLTAEVQEMLGPMLGTYSRFQRGLTVDEVVDDTAAKEGLARLEERLAGLYAHIVSGRWSLASLRHQEVSAARDLESVACLAAGIVLLGSACCERLRLYGVARRFQLEPAEGVFWRFIFLLTAGGMYVDEVLAKRLFAGSTVRGRDGLDKGVGDISFPIRLRSFEALEGYNADIVRVLADTQETVEELVRRAGRVIIEMGAELEAGAAGETTPARPTITRGSEVDRSRMAEPDAAARHFLRHLVDLISDTFDEFRSDLETAGIGRASQFQGRLRQDFGEDLLLSSRGGRNQAATHSRRLELLLRSLCGFERKRRRAAAAGRHRPGRRGKRRR